MGLCNPVSLLNIGLCLTQFITAVGELADFFWDKNGAPMILICGMRDRASRNALYVHRSFSTKEPYN